MAAGRLILLELLACIIISLASIQQQQLQQQRQRRQHPSTSLLILSEICHYPINMTIIQQQLDNRNVTIDVLDKNYLCDDHQKILQILSTSSQLIVGSLNPDVCAPAHHLAMYFNVSAHFWNCPTLTRKKINHPNEKQPQPPPPPPAPQLPTPTSISEIAGGFARVVADMKWKSVAIIGIASGWWPLLAQTLELELRDLDIVPKHSVIFDKNVSLKYIENKLHSFTERPCQAIIFCLSATDTGMRILQISSKLHFPIDNILFIFMDILSLPSWKLNLHKLNGTVLLDNVLFFLEMSTWNSTTIEENIVKNINDSFVFINDMTSSSISSSTRNISLQSAACFVLAEIHLLDYNFSINFHSLLKVIQTNNDSQQFRIEFNQSNFDEWLIRHKQLSECDRFCQLFSDNLVGAWIYWLLACLIVIVLISLSVMAFMKYRLLMKGNQKSPYKVLLSTTDFVFPQLTTESRGVDEGIEAMLCCWLQQLQEFGGPEVDKPDLLQNSGNGGGGGGVASTSIRTPLQASSTPNLAKKQAVFDHRVRYNGDLVQMKPVPSSNNIELKAKSIEIIQLLHGLRHENLNPLIGILAEPPRAALVSEYCTRGSLQDVLQQDDIKLDWSFRLSLLTDLVRGMKYLHSTQIRVHGYLTSRNCVIDSRWVLKVTDYGLPYFYEAQNISPPTKSARELLWTAPELLRHSGLRKKGTQPGDVYSFGIILQEVVVRGEPFCMLALSPEEIIEKVKHPPPLIRPSVSKGAAPPEAINIMRQCWFEQADMRPDFNEVNDQFKKLNHGRKVNIVDTMFQMLEKYSNNLEELIRERTEQLDIEKKKTEQLLNRMLPSYVAEKLKLGMPVDPEEYGEVTIYFSDIVGFTTISAHSTPFQVVDLLNDLYTCFDATINAYNVYKVETIGDAYMVVGGLPVRIPDHAEQIATMALDLLHESGKFRIRHLPGTPLRLRIGLHTGPCCAGVVGLTMPRYCLFGDTVNTASRMESTGAAWRIHMSEVTHMRLQKAGGYQIEYRGLTEIKGKGTMDTYWLLSKDGFNKELPVPPSIDLDESLIISTMPMTMPEIVEDSLADSLSIESLRHMSVSEGHTKASSPNPTFIRSMEVSKFSSLSRYDDRFSMYSDRITKSTSGENSVNLGVPVCASDVTAALLGASTNSLCPYRREHRGPGKIKEEYEDISTPYNHYKSLSPKHRTGKLLRRQFSLDRSEDPNKTDELASDSPRLCKQNSAGAAADLEKIEEVPSRLPSTIPSISSQIHCMISVSADSLIRQ